MGAIKDLNTSLFYQGKGPIDSKANVTSIAEMEDALIATPDFYGEGDIIWVREKEAFYIITVVTASPRVLGYKGISAGDGLYFGAQEDLFKGIQDNDPVFYPGARGYEVGDVLVVGMLSTAELILGYDTYYNVWDIYRVTSPTTYAFDGSLKGGSGTNGTDGLKGDKGEQGESFTVDAQGPIAVRSAYCSMDEGFSFFATDLSLIYFKTTDGACTWTVGTPFGQGKVGATTFQVYVYSALPGGPNTPTGINVPTGWFDSPGDAAAAVAFTPGDGKQLWMSKATYRANSDFTLVSGEPAFIWSYPTQISGVDGIDGKEGIAAGFWAIWSDLHNPTKLGIPKPVKDVAGADSWTPAGADWYDDVTTSSDPKWTAMVLYDTTAKVWKEWAFSKIAGESPALVITMYARGITAKPTYKVPYKTAGKPTVATDVEVHVTGWTAAPPVPSGNDKLFMTTISVDTAGSSAWSNPVQIDGEEGAKAGYFMIWSDATSEPTLPADPNTIISGDQIALGAPWYDDVSGGSHPLWSASTYWKFDGAVWKWSDWVISKLKGDKGATGSAGMPGGTIVMVNSNFNLGSFPKPRHPTEWGKGGDPSISASFLQNAPPSSGNTWTADSAGTDAVYLAIMTFGFNGTISAWSSWKITRIKGLDAGWDQVNDLEVIGNSMFTIDVSWAAPDVLIADSYLITVDGVTKATTGLTESFSGLTAGMTYAIIIKAVKDAKVYTPSSIIGETSVIKTTIKITETAGASICTDELHTRYMKGLFFSPPNGSQIYTNSACTTKWSPTAGNHVILEGVQKVKRYISSTGVIGSSAGLCPISL